MATPFSFNSLNPPTVPNAFRNTGGGPSNGSFLAQRQAKNVLQQRANASSSIPPGEFARLLGNVGAGTGASVPPQSQAPSLISVSKDPEFEGDISRVLDSIRGGNLGELVRDNQSQRLADATGRAFERFRGDVKDSRQSLADFNREFLSVRPSDRGIVEQENAALGRVFAGAGDPNSLEARLAANADARKNAVNQAVRDVDLARVVRAGKTGRLTGGDSSFLDRQLGNAAGDILTRQAVADTDLRRQNILDLTGAQGSLAGVRGRNIDDFIRRGLLPIQAQQALSSSELANLGQLGNIELANTITERRGDNIARELGLLGGINNLRRANRFEGLQMPFDPGQSPDFRGIGAPNLGPDPDFSGLLRSPGGASFGGGPVFNPFFASVPELLDTSGELVLDDFRGVSASPGSELFDARVASNAENFGVPVNLQPGVSAPPGSELFNLRQRFNLQNNRTVPVPAFDINPASFANVA